MELRVESAELPAGCFVSVRIGEVLKQGRYEPQRCYHFPGVDRRRNAKIDIYRHVGTSTLTVDPDVLTSHQVDVTSMDPSFMASKIQVHVQSRKEEINKPARDDKSKALKNQAKEYLTKHRIEERLSEAVKALLKEQPDAPTDFLVTHLTGGRPPVPPVSQASPEKTSSREAAKEQVPEASAPSKAAGQRQDLAVLRQQAAEVLTKASADGSLTQVLQEIKSEDQASKQQQELEATRLKAYSMIVEAAGNGQLDRALKDRKQPRKNDENTDAQDSTQNTKAADEKRERTQTAKSKAAGLLMEAADNGELEKALQEIKQDSTQSTKAANEKKERTQALKSKASGLLMEAADNGELEKALREIKQDSTQSTKAANEKKERTDALKSKAAGMLVAAADNGELEKALQEVHSRAPNLGNEADEKKEHKDTLKSKAAGLLMEAADNGELEKALLEIKQGSKPNTDAGELKSKAASLLTQAAASGQLEKALEEVMQETAPNSKADEKQGRTDALRAKAAGRLLEASTNGEFERALQEITGQGTKADDKATLSTRPSKAVIQAKVSSMMLTAAESGLLEKVLQETMQETR
eukprot:TRINITY_DN10271_c0_g1_i1.p1 TRINITY_DN10271_c0_g1~~TRINITY_DN10271_c0_g1_i1.p1  ORF type:complete len:583 (-),score=148.48 TRINITY_DN10271_c0_g1_i1:92-1840(-)